MNINFKQFMEQETNHFKISGDSYLNHKITNGDYDNMIGKIPNIDFNIPNSIPKIKRTSKITVVERNKNPIMVMLSDGTKMYFTFDEFRRIPGGEPKLGKNMTVTFQRHPNDKSESASQVDSVLVH